jgi:hypothetical protein
MRPNSKSFFDRMDALGFTIRSFFYEIMRNLLAFLLFSLAMKLSAQEPVKESLAPCGSPNGIDPWLIDYKRGDPVWVDDRSADTLYVAMQIHRLAKDNGAGRFSPNRTLDAICRLNEDMKASKIQFFSTGDWNQIDSSAWYQHQTIPQGIDMMLQNNVPNALNCYFVSNPAGNCGYNIPYAGVALSHACSGSNDHTWAHEVGHALALPHPFLGWEGKTYNYSNPTPLQLTYDYTYFHDSIEVQVPAPLDTALVEYLDQSNCLLAADLLCDTKADYLSYRWPCDANGQSTTKQKDPNGQDFYSDGTLFMSYSLDECSNRFSEDQIETMRVNLLDKKSSWIAASAAIGPIESVAELLNPIGGAQSPSFGTTVSWAPVENATHYLVQVSRLANFAGLAAEAIVKDPTVFTLGQLTNDVPYYWRVRAFSHWDACTAWSSTATFQSTPTVGVQKAGENDLRCYPTLLDKGQPLTIEWGSNLTASLQLELTNLLGQTIWESSLRFSTEKAIVNLPSNLAKGTYLLRAQNGHLQKTSILFIKA